MRWRRSPTSKRCCRREISSVAVSLAARRGSGLGVKEFLFLHHTDRRIACVLALIGAGAFVLLRNGVPGGVRRYDGSKVNQPGPIPAPTLMWGSFGGEIVVAVAAMIVPQ
jgi:hypothetical protein